MIFVYAISKISELAHHPHNGIIEPLVLISFILSSLAVLQEWLYLTNYLNRFGTFNIKEIVIMCINMGAAIYLSNSLSLDWKQNFYPFNISMLIMSSSVAFLYHCQAMKKGVGKGINQCKEYPADCNNTICNMSIIRFSCRNTVLYSCKYFRCFSAYNI